MGELIDNKTYWNPYFFVKNAYVFCNQTLELFYNSPILRKYDNVIESLYDSIKYNPHDFISINAPEHATFDSIKKELQQINHTFSDEFINKIVKCVNIRDIITDILNEPYYKNILQYEKYTCIPDYVIRTIFYFNDIVHNYFIAKLVAQTIINACR